jgi:hypothetical protein
VDLRTANNQAPRGPCPRAPSHSASSATRRAVPWPYANRSHRVRHSPTACPRARSPPGTAGATPACLTNRVTREHRGRQHALSITKWEARPGKTASLPHTFIAPICWRRSGLKDSADKQAQRAPRPRTPTLSASPHRVALRRARCDPTPAPIFLRPSGRATLVLRRPRARNSLGTTGSEPTCPPSSAGTALHRARCVPRQPLLPALPPGRGLLSLCRPRARSSPGTAGSTPACPST